MAGVNKVILVGNLGKDPEVRYLENGSVVANVTIATSESYKDRNGNRVENTEWHDLEMWDGLAKIAEQYLKKGKTIYVEGRIKSDTWQDDQGMNRKKIRIRVQNMTMLGNAGGGPTPPLQGGNPQQHQQDDAPQTPESISPPAMDNTPSDITDDLPF
jgi:single-strand DNA-binding protein